ncbi:NAD kinase [Culicoidibacter larvae]|uniref:NAD kinase n=1 Tax=Culicoidibacter larvae TaxID=2579976 RepID=A0A5R8QBD9_9FIRM|nr:NAD kinase [Culicoidibacter larvae]TLG73822.1 NAD kinase [Culicoidibacter larvae]
MRFCAIARNDEQSKEKKSYIIERLQQGGFKLDLKNPELVISIGGDGTLLEAFQRYSEKLDSCMFLGIHSGSLGFYTDWHISEVDEVIEHILRDNYTIAEFPVLDVEIDGTCGILKYRALNEITVLNSLRTLRIDVTINGLEFETFRGTGLCVSTPSGSTGYNKSLGGALLHPDLLGYQLTEIASINNNVYRTIGSPMVLGKKHIIEFHFVDHSNVTLTYDHLNNICSEVKRIRTGLSDSHARFVRYRPKSFWGRVRDAFI